MEEEGGYVAMRPMQAGENTTQRLPMLTEHGIHLIEKLSHTPNIWISAADLAQTAQLSRRTVLRELGGVEQWLTAAGYHFQRKPGVGLMLEESPQVCQMLRIRLQEAGERSGQGLPKQQRRYQLAMRLLTTQEPCNTSDLAHEMGVSFRGIAADLDELAQWMASFEIQLVRRPGVGITVKGTRQQRQRAMGALIQLSLSAQERQALLRGRKVPHILCEKVLEPEVVERVWQQLSQFEQENQLTLTDTGFLSLALHLVLTIQRLREGDKEDEKGVEHPEGWELAQKLARGLEQSLKIRFPSQEIYGIAQHLQAYRHAPCLDDLTGQEWTVRFLAMNLMSQMSTRLGVGFSQSPTLMEDLCCHLRPMLQRLSRSACQTNPQLEVICQQYPQLWQAVRSSCDAVSQQMEMAAIPDDEAAYLAMHFGAVWEETMSHRRKFRVHVVCPYGISASRFLSAQLQREFPQLEVQGVGSVRHLDPVQMEADGVDLVISTVPLELNIPHVCVSPVLQKQDMALLEATMKSLEEKPRPVTHPGAEKVPEVHSARLVAKTSAAVLALLDHLVIRPVAVPGTRAELISEAAYLFASDQKRAEQIHQALLRRENLGDTYVPPLHALLLHCRTNSVDGCRLGYLQAQPPVYEPGKVIVGALVLLAPDREDGYSLPIMQKVSELLIDEPGLMQALYNGDRVKATGVLEGKLIQCFPLSK